MDSLIVTPRNKAEKNLIAKMLQKMDIKVSILSEEDKEDLGLSMLMKEADRSKKVSKEVILQKLKAK
ncbi:MAG: hypothetical protein ACK4GN_17475 [Runella sp.]